MLLRKYKIPVVQYVIFIGEGKVTMPTVLTNRNSSFAYDIIALSSIDYRVFLRSDKPEEKMLAILADLGKENIALAVKQIAVEIDQAAKGDLERERRKKQLRVLAQLRTLVIEILKNMVSVASFYKEENDIFYLRGEKHGMEKATLKTTTAVVKKLLAARRFTIEEIANYAGVTEEFVLEVQKSL